MPTLPDDEYCIYHSDSELSNTFRRSNKRKRVFDRSDLLKELVKDFKTLGAEKQTSQTLRLRAQFGSLIYELLKDLNRIDELEKLIDERL